MPDPRLHPRVLLLHNRYRVVGGEERSVELQLRALERAGIEHALLERRSAGVGRAGAAAAMLRGGSGADAVAAAVRDLGATVVHVHNMLPLIGPRGLSAAPRRAKVVLHLHNVRLFCATGFGERDGGPCARCRGRNTLPGLRLNCRDSLPEAAVYAAGLARHQPNVLAAVDRFVTPSAVAADLVARLGLPARADRAAGPLPAGRVVRRGIAGGRGRSTRWWPRGCRRRRASTRRSRPRPQPAFRCVWRGTAPIARAWRRWSEARTLISSAACRPSGCVSSWPAPRSC